MVIVGMTISLLFWISVQKPNSWMYTFVEGSGHNFWEFSPNHFAKGRWLWIARKTLKTFVAISPKNLSSEKHKLMQCFFKNADFKLCSFAITFFWFLPGQDAATCFPVTTPVSSCSGTKAWANRPRLKINSPGVANNIFFLAGCSCDGPLSLNILHRRMKQNCAAIFITNYWWGKRETYRQTNQLESKRQMCSACRKLFMEADYSY